MLLGLETEDACCNQQRRLILAAYVAAGRDESQHAWHTLRERHLDADLLTVAPALRAALLGAVAEGTLLLFLFSLGHIVEERALDGARSSF